MESIGLSMTRQQRTYHAIDLGEPLTSEILIHLLDVLFEQHGRRPGIALISSAVFAAVQREIMGNADPVQHPFVTLSLRGARILGMPTLQSNQVVFGSMTREDEL